MSGLGLGLVFHPTRDVAPVAMLVVKWAQQHGLDVHVQPQDYHRAPEGVIATEADVLPSVCDALVSIGGDGTMLGALRLTVNNPKPVLGVNVGRLGFLVEVDPPALPAALDRISAKDFTLEPHSCLRATIGDRTVAAFNDLALARRPGQGFVKAALAVDGQQYGHYRGDALVVATPAGSTAYSYAAGGPIVSPCSDVVVITPIAPMSGISRSLVLSVDEVIELGLLPGSGRAAVEVDGQVIDDLGADSTVEVSLHREAGLVIRFDAGQHRQRSHLKLSLLDLPLLPDQLRELLPAPVRKEVERRRPNHNL
jgi:NAD+ kinase